MERVRRVRAERGFSLIELAVVVLIIAVLIAVAIPVFLGARTRAQDTEAMTSLGYAVGAERGYYADAGVYTTDPAALRREIQQAVTFVTGTPAEGGKEVAVTVADVGSEQDQQDQLVCRGAVAAAGRTFTVKDMAQGASAGTWYLRGEDPGGCTTDVGGYTRDWAG